MKKIIVINSCQGKKDFIFENLSYFWYSIILADNIVPKTIEQYIYDFLKVDTFQVDSAYNAIINYCKDNQIEGILTFWEDDVLLTAKLNQTLNLSGIPFYIAQNIRNKYNFRKISKKLWIPSPYFLKLTEEILENLPENIIFPWVIKPSFWASSAYITLCKNKNDLIYFYKKISKEINENIESALHDWLELFYESFIEWKEIDIDMLIQNWECKYIVIADNNDTWWPYFQEIWQNAPSLLDENLQKLIKEQAINYIQKLWIYDACLHFEAKVFNNILIPIEINLRMWWDEVWYFNKYVYGVDLVEMSTKIACWEKIWDYKNIKSKCQLYGEYILPHKKWIITKININYEKLKELWVIKINLNKKEGDFINIPPNEFSFIGWFILKMNTINTKEKDKFINNIKNFISITID